MYEQLYEYLNNHLNDLLRGFRKVHSTQHALFRLIQSCQCYAMSKFIVESGLEDIWKMEKPDSSGFTHCDRCSSTRSRIDRIYTDITVYT